jgi:transposase
MFLGIDVSKNTLDVALLSAGAKPRHKVFANAAAGHTQLLAWIEQHASGEVHASREVHACLEATGTWATDVALALHAAGHE